ncbi:hypothetical protein OAJ93_03940 [Gammaproteobacteria bacterium]|nr:hypothetical protein [Gammaproteobacteria bacterium]
MTKLSIRGGKLDAGPCLVKRRLSEKQIFLNFLENFVALYIKNEWIIWYKVLQILLRTAKNIMLSTITLLEIAITAISLLRYFALILFVELEGYYCGLSSCPP